MYVTTKIKERNIYPWIKCPQNNCNIDLTCEKLVATCGGNSSSSSSSSSSTRLEQVLCQTYLSKWIVRYPEWTPCTSSSCNFGFLVTNSMENKKIRCGVCNTKQTVRRKKEEQDESLKQMVREGTLRPCPKCKMLTMKEFGVCNVIDVSGVLQCLPIGFRGVACFDLFFWYFIFAKPSVSTMRNCLELANQRNRSNLAWIETKGKVQRNTVGKGWTGLPAKFTKVCVYL